MNKSDISRSSEPATSAIIADYHDLIISIILIVTISLAAQLLRIIISKLFLPGSWLRVLLQEVVATAEMCATCFELGNVAENYGVSYYAIFYFASSLWWALTWKEAYASPNSHFEDFLTNEKDGGTAIVASATEVVTACLVFRLLMRPLWAFNYIQIHEEKVSGICSADLSVRPIYGSIIEGGGTLIFSIVSKIIVGRINSEKTATVLNSLLDTILVVLAYDYSGGYFNPVLATSMQYGCEGATATDHFVVYWIGGLIGTLIAVYYNKASAVPVEKQD